MIDGLTEEASRIIKRIQNHLDHFVYLLRETGLTAVEEARAIVFLDQVDTMVTEGIDQLQAVGDEDEEQGVTDADG